jgi:hypothetical protein
MKMPNVFCHRNSREALSVFSPFTNSLKHIAEDLFIGPAVRYQTREFDCWARALAKMEESLRLIQRQQSEVILHPFVEFSEKFVVFYQRSSDKSQSNAMTNLLNAVGGAIFAFVTVLGHGDVCESGAAC